MGSQNQTPKRRYLQNADGSFAGSVSLNPTVPQATPKLPGKAPDVFDRYVEADAVSANQIAINNEVVKNMDIFLDSLEEYARASEEASKARLAKMEREIDEVSAKIANSLERIDRMIQENRAAQAAAAKRNRSWWSKLFSRND